jgi:hypothetical protein
VINRTSRRDLIVRIGRSVHFARLIETSMADAIWDRMPIYGLAERTVDGTLAIGFELSSDLTLPAAPRALGRSSITYCLLTRRIVFPVAAATNSALLPWANFVEPAATADFDMATHGTRVSLLHADS